MPPLRLLPLLVALVVLTGCETSQIHKKGATYTKLRVTNERGEMISEWIVVGPLTAITHGYRITAVERRSAPPYSEETRYPDGWRTTAVGPHIWRWTCAKPAWLAGLDDDPQPEIKPEWKPLSRRPM